MGCRVLLPGEISALLCPVVYRGTSPQPPLSVTPDTVLQKAAGYHLDLFWVGILMAVCSFMGLPWYVAATVISSAHIDSLKMETETSAPGEQPQFLGVR